MAANDVMFNIGIRLDADKFTTETQAIVSDLQKTLNKNGITVPVNLNNATLKEFDQFIQSIGGNMKIVKDDFTGAINAITVSIPKANGQILNLNQGVQAVYKSFVDINGVTQQVFSHFATTNLTSTVSGMNKTFETVKQLQSDIVKQTQQRVQLENQLADALVQGDSKQQASLKNKLDKNTSLETMYREQLEYLQQQANVSGLQVDYFEAVNNQVNQIVEGTASWNSTMIQNGQESIQLAQNLSQSKDILTEYFNAYKKAMSAEGGQYQQMLIEDFQNMKPAVDAIVQSMTNLGAVVDSNGASYNGNITAVQELVDLYNKLTRQTQEYNTQIASKESDAQQIEQAVQAYKEYRDQLDKVYKLKKQNASGNEIKQEEQSLNQLKQAYKQLEQGILSNGEAVYKNTQYNRDKNQVTRDSIQAQKELNVVMQDNSLQDLIADTITYTLSLQSLQQAVESVISETISLNDSMTQIRLVTQGSAEETKALITEYSDIAKQLGTTTSAVAESATEWLRQGNTVEETNELIKASTTLSVIGSMDAADATTALTASLNGYKLEAQDAMKIVDQLTALDLEYATSSSDIANAMSKVASSASQAGVPLERLEAIIAVTSDQTQQAAETIGRAWQSILQRINKISAGKDIEETGESLNDVDKALKTVGISLRDENGIIKESSVILDEVAEKWNTWNKNQQSQIATAIAGTNQANIFRSTMASYNEVLTATTIAENANGSATERMSIYTESLTAKINSLKTAWTQFVNNLNLDSAFGGLIDLATKFIELLDVLLNKIPILSSVLKNLIAAQSINILAGATVKAINKISGPEGISGLLSGLISLNKTVKDVGTTTAASSAGVKTLSSALSALGISANMALGIIGVLIATLSAAYYVWDNYISIEGRLENANKKLSESIDELNETKDIIAELTNEKQELENIPTDELTYGEKNRLDIINDQLETYQEILKTKQEIANSDQKEYNEIEFERISSEYSGDNSLDSSRNNTAPILSGASFSQNITELERLIQASNDLANGNEDVLYSMEEISKMIEDNKELLREQYIAALDDKTALEDMGYSGTQAYKDLLEQIEVYKALMNPSDWENNTIEKLVDFDAIVEDIVSGGEKAANAIKQTAENVANEIQSDSALKSAAEAAFNLDLDTTQGYQELVNILTNDIPIAYQKAQESAEGLTTEQIQLSEAFKNDADALSQYASDVQDIASKQEILNTAFSEMNDKGQITIETMQTLIQQEPELASSIKIVNGVITVEIDSLQQLSDKYYDTAIAQYQFQVDSLQSAADGASKRIQAYSNEMSVLDDLIEKMATANKESWTANDWAQYKGMVMTRDQLSKDQETVDEYNRYLNVIESLQALKGNGLSYTGSSSSGSSGSSSDPEKEAYELQKSEIELIQKQLELEKSKLEQKKDEIESQKSVLELQKSELELQKQVKEQQLEIIQDSEDGIDSIIELIKKMNEQDYENLKDNLQSVKDYISDFKDSLDAVKDTYDDIVDSAKDKLQAEKESLDNQKKLQESAKSISEIQAQLAEIQYDDSSDAQAKRIELTAQLNEAQQEMQDELEDQAYDSAVDSLDATKDKVDSIFESIGEILEISENAIEDYITYISDELESEGNLYLQAVTLFNDTSEGAREELYNRLVEWNQEYGDNVTATVTEPWNQAIEAVEKYKEAVGSTDIDSIRQYLGNQDISLSQSIKIDEQSIDGLTSQIDEIQISMDKVDSQINQFEQAIDRVKDSLSQLEINYQKNQNSESASSIGASGTGNDYAYNLMKQLLIEAGIDTSELPSTYQQFVDGLSSVTEAATSTSESVEEFGNKIQDSSDAIDVSGEKAESAGYKVEQTEQPLDALAEQGDRAADALGNVANEGSTSTGTNTLQGMFELLTGGDVGKFVETLATKAIARYLPKLLSAGISAIGKLHDGTSEVKKSDSWLDKMLGLGKDETVKILKVGEAVIPDYANNINDINNNKGIYPEVSIPNTPNVKTTNNSSLTIDMGDLDINGIDTTELRNELENIKNESANRVYQTLNRYIRVGGYRNVKNRYN